ncbi:MAG: Holliday junction resolvase RuvX [Vallitaleaceae bacterium]|jgi:putative Holliday junction resolvase|nr:Holliday junction resolvase RuvX [Vallitaleaceae bacterium]
MERILGLDYGDKTVGVAISDPFGWTAQGIETIHRTDTTNLILTIERLATLIKSYDVKKIVLGNPLHMNADKGERVDKTNYFKNKLEQTFDLPVIMWDERLTTKSATRTLDEAGVHKSKHKAVIDKIAAVLILQGYLEAVNNNGGNELG